MKRNKKPKSIIKYENGRKIEFQPIITKCSYHRPTKKVKCPNCDNTGYYTEGYFMIIDDKIAFQVDNIK